MNDISGLLICKVLFCIENFKAAIESLLSGAVCGILYHLFAGQPLTILGSTGPVLVFETIVNHFCTYDTNPCHCFSFEK